jgi:amino acid transporter
VARGVGHYTAQLLPWTGTASGEATLAIGIIAAFTALNYVGIRPAAWVLDAFTVGKLLPLALLAMMGLASTDWDQLTWKTASTEEWGRAWFLCMFAMSGYENVGLPAGETTDARRAVPIGILGAVGSAALIYITVQIAVVGVLPDLADSKAPLAEAAAALFGPAGAVLLSVGAVVSMVGFTCGSALLTPRALVALAEHRDLPVGLAASHPRYGSPHRAILLSGGIAITLAAVLGFGALADFGLVATFMSYALSCAGLLRLRRRPDLPPPRFRIPAAPVMVTVAVGISLVLATQAGWTDVAWAVGLLAAGFGLRYRIRAAQRPSND